MKDIKIIIRESKDRDGDSIYIASLAVFPEVKFETYNIDQARMILEKEVSMDIGFKNIDLASFPDFVPNKLEQEFNVFSEGELLDNDLYHFTYIKNY